MSLLVVGVVGGLVFSALHSLEPQYAGETLSEWVEGFGVDDGRHARILRVWAIQQMGTNAMQYLRKWSEYETPTWKEKLFEVTNKALGWPGNEWWQNNRKVMRSHAARATIEALRGWSPDVRSLLDCPVPSVKFAAVDELVRRGEIGLPLLLEGLTNQPYRVRIYIVERVPQMGAAARPAVPILRAVFADADWEMRSAVNNALRKIEPQALQSHSVR